MIQTTTMMIQVWCKEEDIEIPGGRIEGPDPGLEGKEFVALLTVNNKEKVAASVISLKKIFVPHRSCTCVAVFTMWARASS